MPRAAPEYSGLWCYTVHSCMPLCSAPICHCAMQASSRSTAPAPQRAAPSPPVPPQRASLGSVRPWAVARARRPIRCCTRDPGNYRCSQLCSCFFVPQLPCDRHVLRTPVARSKLLENGPVPSVVAWPAQPVPHMLVCSCARLTIIQVTMSI